MENFLALATTSNRELWDVLSLSVVFIAKRDSYFMRDEKQGIRRSRICLIFHLILKFLNLSHVFASLYDGEVNESGKHDPFYFVVIIPS